MAYIIHRAAKLHTINAYKRHNEAPETAEHVIASEWTDSKIKEAYHARKNAVIGIEGIYTATPGALESLSEEEQHEFFMNCLEFHKKTYGSTIICADIHHHESTVHMHIISIPEDERGKLNAAKLMGNRYRMRQIQTEIAEEVGKWYDLKRGKENSKARHAPLYSRTEAQKRLKEAQEQMEKAARALEAAQRAQEEAEAEAEKYIPIHDYNPTL